MTTYLPLLGVLALLGMSACQRVHRVLVNCPPRCEAWGNEAVDVRVFRDGRPLPMRKGRVLKRGDRIEVGSDHVVVIRLKGGIEATLMPGTNVVLGSLTLEIGRVMIQARERFKRNFELFSASWSAVPVGTEFIATFDGQDHFVLEVLKGQVNVTGPNTGRGASKVLAGQRLDLPSARRTGAIAPQDMPLGDPQSLATEWNTLEAKVHPVSPRMLVPTLVGLPKTQAVRLMNQANTPRLGTVDATIQGNAPINEVVAQTEPAGSRLRSRRTVGFTYRSLAILMPDVLGLLPNTAKGTLSALTFVPKEKALRILTCLHPPGTVTRQDPLPSTPLPERAKVTLTMEARSALVPPVIGLSEADAVNALTARSLAVGTVHRVPTVGVQQARIVRQHTGAQACVLQGSRVDVDLEVPGVVVPSIKGQDAGVGARAITAAGLVAFSRGDAACPPWRGIAGFTAYSQPEEREIAELGTVVEMWSFAPSAVMPNVLGRTQAEAIRLVGGRVTIGKITQTVVGPSQKGPARVTGSRPAPNGRMCVGEVAQVDLDEPSFRLPSVVDMPESVAQALLQDLGFSVSLDRQTCGFTSPGSIVAQSVAPGIVPSETVVTLTCRLPPPIE